MDPTPGVGELIGLDLAPPEGEDGLDPTFPLIAAGEGEPSAGVMVERT